MKMASSTNAAWRTVLAMLVLALLGGVSVVQGEDSCASFAIKAKASRKTVSRGGRLTLTYSVTNEGKDTITNSGFAVSLPPGVAYKRASASRMTVKATSNIGSAKGHGRNSTVIKDVGPDVTNPNVVYWPYAPINAGKTRRFSVKLQVVKCKTMPESLLFEAYMVQVENDVLVCQFSAPVVEVAVKTVRDHYTEPSSSLKTTQKKFGSKNETVGRTTAVCPLSYYLVDVGYTCAEAGDPIVFVDGPTPEDCYGFCYWYGGAASPFFFDFYIKDGERFCTCIGDTCTLVPAADHRVYESYPNVPPPPDPGPPPPPGPYPPVLNATVPPLSTGRLPPPAGEWNNGFDSSFPSSSYNQEVIDIRDPVYVAEQTGVTPIPSSLTNGPFDSAYLMQTTDGSSKATTSIYFYPPNSAFNSMLFKDFAQGMEGSYWFYILSQKLQAPSYKIYTASVALGRTSVFVWTPANNGPIQGGMSFQTWIQHSFNQNTGTSGDWPLNPRVGGYGWWCTQNCYLPKPLPPGYGAGPDYRRSLRTYVDAWATEPAGSDARIAYNDSVIVGFQLGIGSGESYVTAFVKDFLVSTTAPNALYNWQWTFETA